MTLDMVSKRTVLLSVHPSCKCDYNYNNTAIITYIRTQTRTW